jgi:hypothetical protein
VVIIGKLVNRFSGELGVWMYIGSIDRRSIHSNGGESTIGEMAEGPPV